MDGEGGLVVLEEDVLPEEDVAGVFVELLFTKFFDNFSTLI